jgi:hypothetical protein
MKATKSAQIAGLPHFPQGRLEAHIVEFNADKGFVLVQAKAWRTSR